MKKESKSKYPWNWNQISANVIFGRAQNRCESCKLLNGSIIERMRMDRYRYVSKLEIDEMYYDAKKESCSIFKILKRRGYVRIILTCAHLNHNEMDCSNENLKALCQRCHLNYDRSNNRFRAQVRRLGLSQTKLEMNTTI